MWHKVDFIQKSLKQIEYIHCFTRDMPPRVHRISWALLAFWGLGHRAHVRPQVAADIVYLESWISRYADIALSIFASQNTVHLQWLEKIRVVHRLKLDGAKIDGTNGTVPDGTKMVGPVPNVGRTGT